MDRHAASRFYQFDDGYFDGLRAALAGRIHLCVVQKGDAIAGASLFVETSGVVQHHLLGFDLAFEDAHPTKLMVHFASIWARARGNRVLHLGGGVGAERDSLMAYKAGFSSRRHPYWTLRLILGEAQNRRLVSALDPTADPTALDGYFPLYRREPTTGRSHGVSIDPAGHAAAGDRRGATTSSS